LDRCALFVDASYALADGALAVHGTRNRDSVSWDYAGLLKLLSGLSRDRTGLPMLRCYWYDTAADGDRAAEHDTLADIPGLKLRLSKARPSRKEGVEAEIRKDLTALARNRAVSDVIIVSAEEDLAPVIAEVQDLGIRTIVLSIAADGDWAMSRSLRQECDDIIEISPVHLRPYVDLIAGAEPQVGAAEYRELSAAAAQASGPHPALEAPAMRLFASPVAVEYEPASRLASQGSGTDQDPRDGQRRPDAARFAGTAAVGLADGMNSAPVQPGADSQPHLQMQGQQLQASGQTQHYQHPDYQHPDDGRGPVPAGAEPGFGQGSFAAQEPASSSNGQRHQPQAGFSPRSGPDDGRGQAGALPVDPIGVAGAGRPSVPGQDGLAAGPMPGSAGPMTGSPANGLSGGGQHGALSQNGMSQHVMSQNGLPQHGMSQNVPQNGVPQSGLPQGAPPRNGPPNASPQNAPTQNGLPQNASLQNASPQNGLPGNAFAQNAPLRNGSPQNASPQNGLPGSGFAQNGPSAHGAPGSQGGGMSANVLPPHGMPGGHGGGIPSNAALGATGVPGSQAAGYPSNGGLPGGGQASMQSNGLPSTGMPGAPGATSPGQASQVQSEMQQARMNQSGLYQDGLHQGSAGQSGPSLGSSTQNGGHQGSGQHGLPLQGQPMPVQPGQPQSLPRQGQGLQGPGQPGPRQQGPGQPGSGQPGSGQQGLPQRGAGPNVPSSPVPQNGMTPMDLQRPPAPQRQLSGGNGVQYQQDRSMPYGGPIQPPHFSGPAGTAAYAPSPYGGQQPAQPAPVAMSVGEAVQSAHAEGFGFGEAVARDAPALWLEAVLARKPRMPSDLEARLLQGSALPIDSLLHDEVRHALRRGFWDALERFRH